MSEQSPHNPAEQLKFQHEIARNYIGGEQAGGVAYLTADSEPLVRRSEFGIQNMPGDLLTVFSAADSPEKGVEAQQLYGLVKGNSEGTVHTFQESGADLFLVRLQKSTEGTYEIALDSYGSPQSVRMSAGEELVLGRNKAKMSPKAQVFQGPEDPLMSSVHCSVQVNEKGLITIKDLNSTNGTVVTKAEKSVSDESLTGLLKERAASHAGSEALAQSVSAEYVAAKEVQVSDREKQLLKPLPTPAELNPDRPDSDYDILLRGNDDEYQAMVAPKPVDYKVENLKKRAEVTAESMNKAEGLLNVLISSKGEAGNLLRAFKESHGGLSTRDLIEAIRFDPELRFPLGKMLLDASEKIGRNVRLGVSIKRPDAPGYEDQPDDMTSSEYASLLVLSRLDGTFKENTSDPVRVNAQGQMLGQHRAYADSLLQAFLEAQR